MLFYFPSHLLMHMHKICTLRSIVLVHKKSLREKSRNICFVKEIIITEILSLLTFFIKETLF